MIEVKEIDERGWLLQRVEELETTNMSLSKNTYAAPHVWNLVAKHIRDEWPTNRSNDKLLQAMRNTLSDLALAFAHRFEEDEGFDPPTWLDKCSPDPDRWPLSEMWDGE